VEDVPRPNTHSFSPPSARSTVEKSSEDAPAPELEPPLNDEHFPIIRMILVDMLKRLCEGLLERKDVFARFARLRGLDSSFDLVPSKPFSELFSSHFDLRAAANVKTPTCPPDEAHLVEFLNLLEAASSAPLKYARRPSGNLRKGQLGFIRSVQTASKAARDALRANARFATQQRMSEIAAFFELFANTCGIFTQGNIEDGAVFYFNVDTLTKQP